MGVGAGSPEREHCCDDLAVQTCGDRVVYARALTSLEELRCGDRQFAMAATGGDLGERVRRLLGSRSRFADGCHSCCSRESRYRGLGRVPEHGRGGDGLGVPIAPAPPVAAVPVERPAPVVEPAAAPEAPQAPTPLIAEHHEGYLGGLADAGYTSISVNGSSISNKMA